MELSAVAAGTILLHRLGKHGAVITDNQGIVKQLLTRRRMCRSGSQEGTTLALPAWAILHEGLIYLRWHHGHPERREKDRQAWSREDWGNRVYARTELRSPETVSRGTVSQKEKMCMRRKIYGLLKISATKILSFF